MKERGMGRSPYPLCAASAAGGALGSPEDGKAQGDQASADEQRQNGICGHDVPNVLDQRGQRRGVTKDGSDSGSRSLGSVLLSLNLWLREEESNLHLQGENLASYLYSHPAM